MASYRALSCSQMVDGKQEETFPGHCGVSKLVTSTNNLWGLVDGMMRITTEMRCFSSVHRQTPGQRLGSLKWEELHTPLLKSTFELSALPQVPPRPLAWILCLLFSSAFASSPAEGATTAAQVKERRSTAYEKAGSALPRTPWRPKQ